MDTPAPHRNTTRPSSRTSRRRSGILGPSATKRMDQHELGQCSKDCSLHHGIMEGHPWTALIKSPPSSRRRPQRAHPIPGSPLSGMTSFALPKLCGAGRQGGSQDRIPVTLAAGQQRPGDRCDPLASAIAATLSGRFSTKLESQGRPAKPVFRPRRTTCHRPTDNQPPEIVAALLRYRPGPLAAARGHLQHETGPDRQAVCSRPARRLLHRRQGGQARHPQGHPRRDGQGHRQEADPP